MALAAGAASVVSAPSQLTPFAAWCTVHRASSQRTENNLELRIANLDNCRPFPAGSGQSPAISDFELRIADLKTRRHEPGGKIQMTEDRRQRTAKTN